MRFVAVLLLVLPAVLADRIQLIGISPEEAQNFIAKQSLDLKYARKLGEAPLPVTRSADGKGFIYKGRSIDNPDDYTEETYEASQFHGQDGLGRAMFGYTDYNQARLEARNANGEVRGSYQYIDPNGENIVVQYWSDSLGFHQTDNIPKVVLVPATDTPENVAARLEHERAWNLAANLAKQNPDPMSDVYNRAANAYDDKQQAEQGSEGSESNQAQGLTRYPANKASPISAAASEVSERKVKAGQYDPEEEVTSEPKGFFYSFEYPVDLLVESPNRRSLKLSNEHQGAPKVRRSEEKTTTSEKVATPVVVESAPETLVIQKEPELAIGEVEKKVNEITVPKRILLPILVTDHKVIDDSPLLKTISLKATEEGAIPVDAIHDAQVHPSQKDGLVNSQLLPVASTE